VTPMLVWTSILLSILAVIVAFAMQRDVRSGPRKHRTRRRRAGAR